MAISFQFGWTQADGTGATVDELEGGASVCGTEMFLLSFNCALITPDGIISFLTSLIDACALALFGPVFSLADANIASVWDGDTCSNEINYIPIYSRSLLVVGR